MALCNRHVPLGFWGRNSGKENLQIEFLRLHQFPPEAVKTFAGLVEKVMLEMAKLYLSMSPV